MAGPDASVRYMSAIWTGATLVGLAAFRLRLASCPPSLWQGLQNSRPVFGLT
jgi:hypothetical protein